MRYNQAANSHHYSLHLLNNSIRHRLGRKLICLSLILSLLALPVPDLAFQLPVLASTGIHLAINSLRNAKTMLSFLFRPDSARPQRETLAERRAYVSNIHITPLKLVGYQGQSFSFSALPTDHAGRAIQGVKFTWESSNSNKAQIDDSGRVTFLQPGLVRIICRAGTVETSAPILIRPGNHPSQTDAEWREDQAGLGWDGNPITSSAGPTSSLRALPSLLRNLAP